MTTIRELRKRKGWSQIQLAIAAGVSPTTISKIERGAGCNAATKAVIAQALDVSPAEVTITVSNRVLKGA